MSKFTLTQRNLATKEAEYKEYLAELKKELHDDPSDSQQNNIEQDMCERVLTLIHKRKADMAELKSYAIWKPLTPREERRRRVLIGEMQQDVPHLNMWMSI